MSNIYEGFFSATIVLSFLTTHPRTKIVHCPETVDGNSKHLLINALKYVNYIGADDRNDKIRKINYICKRPVFDSDQYVILM